MWSLVSLVSAVVVVVALSWLACAHVCVCVRSIACHCHFPFSALKTIAGSFIHIQAHALLLPTATAAQIGGDLKLVSALRFGLGLSFGYLVIIIIIIFFLFYF